MARVAIVTGGAGGLRSGIVGRLRGDGMTLVAFDGVPLGKTNFVPMDSLGRIWFTVTRLHPWTRSINERAADGYVGPAPMMASVTFGGPDRHTVYLGSLMGTTIPCFRSPVRGLPLPHWKPAVGRR